MTTDNVEPVQGREKVQIFELSPNEIDAHVQNLTSNNDNSQPSFRDNYNKEHEGIRQRQPPPPYTPRKPSIPL